MKKLFTGARGLLSSTMASLAALIGNLGKTAPELAASLAHMAIGPAFSDHRAKAGARRHPKARYYVRTARRLELPTRGGYGSREMFWKPGDQYAVIGRRRLIAGYVLRSCRTGKQHWQVNDPAVFGVVL